MVYVHTYENMFVEIVIVDAKELYLSKAFAKVVYNVI